MENVPVVITPMGLIIPVCSEDHILKVFIIPIRQAVMIFVWDVMKKICCVSPKPVSIPNFETVNTTSTHAANLEKLMTEEGAEFGDWRIPTRFVKTATGGSCSPGCHQTFEYDRETPVDYQQ